MKPDANKGLSWNDMNRIFPIDFHSQFIAFFINYGYNNKQKGDDVNGRRTKLI